MRHIEVHQCAEISPFSANKAMLAPEEGTKRVSSVNTVGLPFQIIWLMVCKPITNINVRRANPHIFHIYSQRVRTRAWADCASFVYLTRFLTNLTLAELKLHSCSIMEVLKGTTHPFLLLCEATVPHMFNCHIMIKAERFCWHHCCQWGFFYPHRSRHHAENLE